MNDTDDSSPQNATVICSFGNMDGWKFLTIKNTPYQGKPYLVMNLASDESFTIPKEIKERLHLNLDISSTSGTISVSFLLRCGDLGIYECTVYRDDSYRDEEDLKRKIIIIIVVVVVVVLNMLHNI